MNPGNILVIKSRNLGDVLLVGPLVSTLKAQNPTSRITVLVKKSGAVMISGHPHVHDLLCYPQSAPGEARLAFLIRQLRWWHMVRNRRFDWVINTTEGDRGIITGFLTGAARRTSIVRQRKEKWWRKFLLTEPKTPLPGSRHNVIRNLDLLAPHPPSPVTRTVCFSHSSQAWSRANSALTAAGWDGQTPLVQVHATSRWMFKCWSNSEMAKTIDHLEQRHYRVVLTCGPDAREKARLATIHSLCRTNPLDLGGKLTLEEMAAMTARCQLYLGVDTAPMHMAAALDIPVVALFGPSSPTEWGPWPNRWLGDPTPFPQNRGIQHAGPHTVVQMDWPCVPCGRDGCQGSKRSDCLEQLPASQVIPWVDRVLDQKPSV